MASPSRERLKRIMETSGLSKQQVIDYVKIVERLIEENERNLTAEELEEREKKANCLLDEDEGRIWTPEEIEALIRDFTRMAA